MPSLQVQPTALLDQEEALETIHRRLTSDGVRLLTLTGPAGVGKTRLALEAGLQSTDAFRDGVVFIDFGPIREPRRVLPAIAQALNVGQRDDSSPMERLASELQGRRLLLILDSFDRVLQAAAQVAELLALSPGVTMLVTSRMPLHLRWEQTLRVLPLTVPDLDDLPPLPVFGRISAVVLFLQRAQAINPDFTLTRQNMRSVAELVVHLDGLPLAIELAAARTPVLSPQMIVERLENRLSLLAWQAPDLPEHQRSLDSAIGWSYDLLSVDERILFQQLGVFVGGFDLDAAEAVLAAIGGYPVDVLEGLASLVDKSLIQVTDQDEEHVRYSFLESIREYAWEHLEDHDDPERARQAHGMYFLELAERADPQLQTDQQSGWLARLEQEHDNLDAAFHWLLDHDQQAALRLAATLGYFWWTHGYVMEGWHYLDDALRQAPNADPATRVKALLRAGMILTNRGDLDRAKDVLEDALTLARGRRDHSAVAQCLTSLGARATLAKDWSASKKLLQGALDQWQELGENTDRACVGLTLFHVGALSLIQGEHETAATHLSEAITMYDAIGDRRLAGRFRLYLALTVLRMDDRVRAVQLAQEGVRAGMSVPDNWCLILGADTTVLLLGDDAERDARARLIGMGDALRPPAGLFHGIWELVSGPAIATMRSHLEQEREGPAYQEGRRLPVQEMGPLLQSMLKELSQVLAPVHHGEERSSPDNPLTERELEVLRLVADGLSSRVIGKELFISASTVSYHLTSIFNKLVVDTRVQAVAIAVQRGLL